MEWIATLLPHLIIHTPHLPPSLLAVFVAFKESSTHRRLCIQGSSLCLAGYTCKLCIWLPCFSCSSLQHLVDSTLWYWQYTWKKKWISVLEARCFYSCVGCFFFFYVFGVTGCSFTHSLAAPLCLGSRRSFESRASQETQALPGPAGARGGGCLERAWQLSWSPIPLWCPSWGKQLVPVPLRLTAKPQDHPLNGLHCPPPCPGPQSVMNSSESLLSGMMNGAI